MNTKSIKPILDEKEVKSKMVYQQTYKKGAAWLDDGPTGKKFIEELMKKECPVMMQKQGVLENGVQYMDVRIFFKTD